MTDVEKLHARVWKILRSALPADAIVMGDASQIVYTGSFAMPMEMERCWYYSGTYCALGVALPMAIGAKIGAPHRPVIAVAGDGGIMFTVNELATAAEERLALPVIVWNNDALKEIVDQMDQRQIPRIGVEPKSPDFLRLAQSLGCHATRAASAEHLAQSVRDALAADRPTLIEVRQDSPWLWLNCWAISATRARPPAKRVLPAALPRGSARMQRAGTSHRVLVVDLVARPVGRLEESSLPGVELQPQRLHGDLEVRRLRSTHDRNVVVGAAGDPGHRDVCRAHAPARGHLAHAACDLAIDVVAVDIPGRRRGPCARSPASRARKPRARGLKVVTAMPWSRQ